MATPSDNFGATKKSPSQLSGRRNNQVTNQPRRRGRRQQSYITRKEVNGGKIDVPSNPPEVTYQPWMPLTAVHSGVSGDIQITVRDLVQQIRQQIDPTGHGLKDMGPKWSADECIMQVRIRSIRAWNLTGKMISLSVDDYSDAGKAKQDVDTLCGLVDVGTVTHAPAIGYTMPISHQHIVLRNDNETSAVTLFHVISPNTDNCSMFRLVKNMKTDVAHIRQSTAQMQESVKELVEHDKGSLGNAIVKGTEVLAPYVLPLAAGTEDPLAEKIDRLCSVLQSTLSPDDISIISSEELRNDTCN